MLSKTLLVGAAALSAMFVASQPEERGAPYAGIIYLKSGQPIVVGWFAMEEDSLYNTISWKTGDQKLAIKKRSLARMRVLDSQNFTSELVLKNGQTLVATEPMHGTERFSSLTWYEAVRDSETGQVRYLGPIHTAMSEIDTVIFGATPGVKRCTVDGRYFPGEYWFCPYDATELFWQEQTEHEYGHCSKCNRRYPPAWKYCHHCGMKLTPRQH